MNLLADSYANEEVLEAGGSPPGPPELPERGIPSSTTLKGVNDRGRLDMVDSMVNLPIYDAYGPALLVIRLLGAVHVSRLCEAIMVEDRRGAFICPAGLLKKNSPKPKRIRAGDGEEKEEEEGREEEEEVPHSVGKVLTSSLATTLTLIGGDG